MAQQLLSVKNLNVSLRDRKEPKEILKGADLEVFSESIVGLVGGSGSGKTTLGLSVLRLLPPALQITHGRIVFEHFNILDASVSKIQEIRGRDISMIFQEPLYAFNPVFPIGYQIAEVLIYHTKLLKHKRDKRVLDLLATVGIKDPLRVAKSYPHQLSGGMRQRAMIAQAIAAEPKLIIADEPTSNLDVTLQAKILGLFKELKDRLNLSILLITHDLGMVSHIADKVYVMNKGKVVESGKTTDVLEAPCHEYTKNLVSALNF